MKKQPHGTDAVMEGRLRGATDGTDYFYFFCPECRDDRLLRVPDFQITKDEKGNKYNAKRRRKAVRSFIIAFEITCENCGFHDYVKVSNIGWQEGTHAEALQ